MAKKLTVQKTFDLEAAGAAAKVTVSFEKEQPFQASDFDVVEEALLKLAERVEARAFEQRPMAKEYWNNPGVQRNVQELAKLGGRLSVEG